MLKQLIASVLVLLTCAIGPMAMDAPRYLVASAAFFGLVFVFPLVVVYSSSAIEVIARSYSTKVRSHHGKKYTATQEPTSAESWQAIRTIRLHVFASTGLLALTGMISHKFPDIAVLRYCAQLMVAIWFVCYVRFSMQACPNCGLSIGQRLHGTRGIPMPPIECANCGVFISNPKPNNPKNEASR